MTGYTRQSASNIVPGAGVRAIHLNNEFNQIEAAFGTAGHVHDGTAGNGPQIGTAGLQDNAITLAKMADNSVGTSELINSNVTNAKLADMANKRIKGRITAGAGAPEDLTATDLLTIIKDVDGLNSGLDADVLRGYSLDPNTGANTVAQRDSGGGLNGAAFLATGTFPGIYHYDTDSGADGKRWGMIANGDQLMFQTINDAWNANKSWLEVPRSGNTPTVANFKVPVNTQLPNLGTALNNSNQFTELFANDGNADYLRTTLLRKSAGTNWTSAAWRIQRGVDVDKQGFVQFGAGTDGSFAPGVGLGSGDSVRLYVPNGVDPVQIDGQTAWHAGNLIPDTWRNANTIVKRDNGGNVIGNFFFSDGAAPGMSLYETDGGVDQKRWQIYADNSTLCFQSMNDAWNNATNFLTFNRSGMNVTGANFTCPVVAGGSLNVTSNAYPQLILTETDGTTDNKRWSAWVNETVGGTPGTLAIGPQTDAGAGTGVFQLDRSGNSYFGSRNTQVGGARMTVSPAWNATGAAVYTAWASSGVNDGSPNVLFAGVDGPALNGQAFLDTGSYGVAAASPLDLRTNGGWRMRMDASGVRASVPVYTESANGIVMRANSSGSGTTLIHRQDGSTYWMLVGDYGGVWNSLRPLRVQLSDGRVFMENGLNVYSGMNLSGGMNNNDSDINLISASGGERTLKWNVSGTNIGFYGNGSRVGLYNWADNKNPWYYDIPSQSMTITVPLTVAGVSTGQATVGVGMNAQFAHQLTIAETAHATSRRASLMIGNDWEIIQDTTGNGVKDFGLWHAATATKTIGISTADVVDFAKTPTVNSTAVLTAASGSAADRNLMRNSRLRLNERGGGPWNNLGYTSDGYVLSIGGVYAGGPISASIVPDTSSAARSNNLLEIKVLSVPSAPASGDFLGLHVPVEGIVSSDLKWGTSSAKPLTVSFRAFTNVAGTYSLAVRNGAYNYTCVKTYNLAAGENTITLTFPGATSGTWYADNQVGFALYFGLASGSASKTSTYDTWQAANLFIANSQVNFAGAVNNYFRITDLVAVVGSSILPASAYDRTLQDDIMMCQRYYTKLDVDYCGYIPVGYSAIHTVHLPQVMRAIPTLTYSITSSDNLNYIVQYGTFSNTVRCTYAGPATGMIRALYYLFASAEL